MIKYAHIINNSVYEIIETAGDISEMFHPSVRLIECGDEICVGWTYQDGIFEPPPSIVEHEIVAKEVREMRDHFLATTGWLLERHREQLESGVPTSLTHQQFADLLAYRQALRDVPQQAGFPHEVIWPELAIS